MGGLIAVIPVLITIRNQSIERDKDREEARREAKIHAREKLMERDILSIMDLVNKVLESLAVSGELRNETDFEQSMNAIATLVYSLDEKNVEERWRELYYDIIDLQEINENPDGMGGELHEAWFDVTMAAGKLHRVLREKLISIRNT